MKKHATLFGVGIALFFALPVIAAGPLKSERRDSLTSSPGATTTKARATLAGYATCLVDFNIKGVKEAVSLFPAGPQFAAAMKNLAVDRCLEESQLKFTPLSLRSGLFVALYRKQYRRQAPPLAPTDIDYAAEARGADEESATSYANLRKYISCVVRQDPALAREVVLSTVGSKREEELYGALYQQLSLCLQQDSEVEFSKMTITGLIAEVLYRLSSPPAESE